MDNTSIVFHDKVLNARRQVANNVLYSLQFVNKFLVVFDGLVHLSRLHSSEHFDLFIAVVRYVALWLLVTHFCLWRSNWGIFGGLFERYTCIRSGRDQHVDLLAGCVSWEADASTWTDWWPRWLGTYWNPLGRFAEWHVTEVVFCKFSSLLEKLLASLVDKC